MTGPRPDPRMLQQAYHRGTQGNALDDAFFEEVQRRKRMEAAASAFAPRAPADASRTASQEEMLAPRRWNPALAEQLSSEAPYGGGYQAPEREVQRHAEQYQSMLMANPDRKYLHRQASVFDDGVGEDPWNYLRSQRADDDPSYMAARQDFLRHQGDTQRIEQLTDPEGRAQEGINPDFLELARRGRRGPDKWASLDNQIERSGGIQPGQRRIRRW